MPFSYSRKFLESGFTYNNYRKVINEMLVLPPADAAAEKMDHYIRKNVSLMDKFDHLYQVSDKVKDALNLAPPTTWLVISEGWCGDAAFNLPMLVAVEKACPEKVRLLVFFRDSNLELIDANLTDGGRSIPKMVVLDHNLKVLGHWGPRPAGLQSVMTDWKSQGLELKQLIVKIHDWYDNDATRSVQLELTELIKNYS